MVAHVSTVAFHGIEAREVDVQVHMASGLPTFTVVGLPDKAVGESRERVLDEKTIGFADFRGNRQYVSVGNLNNDDRVSLILMDYPNRARLKILGRARLVGLDHKDTLEELSIPGYRAVVERGIVIRIEAFDWNCSQHITPRFTLFEIDNATASLHQRIAELGEP